MKKNSKFLSFTTLVVCLITSCGDNPEPVPQNPLFGTWLQINESQAGCSNPIDNMGVTACADCVTLVIAQGSLIFSDSNGSDHFTFTTSGTTLITSPSLPGTLTYTLSTDKETLTLTFQSNANGCTGVVTYDKQS